MTESLQQSVRRLSTEIARERREHHQLIAAIIESNGGEIYINDRAKVFFARDAPRIETVEDKMNRRTILRLEREPDGD